MNIKPINDLVIIKVDPPKTKTDSGIIVKENWKTLPPSGEVIAVGDTVKRDLVGKRVIFERYSAVTLEDDLRLCKEESIFGIYED